MTTQAVEPVHAELVIYLCQSYRTEAERTRAALDAWLREVAREGYAATDLPSIILAESSEVEEMCNVFAADLNGEVLVVAGPVVKRPTI